MAGKTRIEFEGFDEVAARLSALGGSVKETTAEALKKSKQLVHQKLSAAMQRHNQTGATVKSLDQGSTVEWAGSMASISVGFHLSQGGLPSVFLMYGTPKMAKDQELYNAVYGNKTKEEVKKIQEDIFLNEIGRLGG